MDKSNFFGKVYAVVRNIPKGKVMTYGQIAEILGTKDARKVGYALHGNTDPDVPCHRVVNKDGAVADNYAFGGWREQKMKLSAESVSFKNETHVDMSKFLLENYNSVQENHGFQPVDELNSDMSSSLRKPRPLGRGGRH